MLMIDRACEFFPLLPLDRVQPFYYISSLFTFFICFNAGVPTDACIIRVHTGSDPHVLFCLFYALIGQRRFCVPMRALH